MKVETGGMVKIRFPIKKAYPSNIYPLIVLDADDICHYWNNEGGYDGCSCDPHIDIDTRINMN